MPIAALPPRPLEDMVSFACRSCQNAVRAIRAIEEDLRKEVRVITKNPDAPTVPAHKEKITELRAKKTIARERLRSHIDTDHEE